MNYIKFYLPNNLVHPSASLMPTSMGTKPLSWPVQTARWEGSNSGFITAWDRTMPQRGISTSIPGWIRQFFLLKPTKANFNFWNLLVILGDLLFLIEPSNLLKWMPLKKPFQWGDAPLIFPTTTVVVNGVITYHIMGNWCHNPIGAPCHSIFTWWAHLVDPSTSGYFVYTPEN